MVSLTPEWIVERLERGVCEATGIPFQLNLSEFHGAHPLAPSLDRITAGGDYSPDNTQLVIWAFNAAKQEWGIGVVIAMAKGLLRQHGEINE